jgi:hypothetical protein
MAGGEGKKLKIASLSIIERGSKPFIVLLCLLTSVEIYKYIKYIINHKERERERRERKEREWKNFPKNFFAYDVLVSDPKNFQHV